MGSPFAFVPPCSFITQSHILSSKSLLVDLGRAKRRSHATKGGGGGCISPCQSIPCFQNQMFPLPLLQTIMTPLPFGFLSMGILLSRLAFFEKPIIFALGGINLYPKIMIKR